MKTVGDPAVLQSLVARLRQDLVRAVAGLEGIASAKPETLEAVHGFFGTMSVTDWQRWAYKHTDHHLRQFDL